MSHGATGAGVGEPLAAARSALGLGEEDVADALNLTARVIANLESEAWDSLPAPAFTRGYIRAYAKLLEIDGEELIQGYERIVGVAETVELELSSTAPRGGVGELLQRQPGTVLSGAAIAGVALVSLIVWAVWPAGNAEPGRVDAGRTAELVQAEQRTDTATPTELEPEPEAELARAVEVPEPESPSSRPEEPIAATEEVSVPGAVVEPPARSARVQRLTPTGEDRLRLEFSADCWVEVTDEANLKLYGDLGRAGDSLDLVGTSPFRVLLGYAPGVVLEYNGEPVQLAGYTRNNVAALWLGRRP